MGLLRLAPAVALALACVPELAGDLSRVDEARVLAARAEPAEAAPGEQVTLTALWADASGTLAEAPIAWSLCSARRPLAELGPIARACLEAGGEDLVPLGTGRSVQAIVPDDACRRFGPEPPVGTPDQPAGRPVDPDPSGGYYQPVLLAPPGDARALLQLRIACGLAGATQAQAAEFRRSYQRNRAPTIAGLGRAGEPELPEGAPLVVDAGEEVDLRVRWPTCPEDPVCGDGLCTQGEGEGACPGDCEGAPGCGGAETYLRFDPAALELRAQRESIRAAWYASGGGFEVASVGRGGDERETTMDNTWSAPDDPGPATIWVVLRDERGGIAWRSLNVEVR